MKNATIEELAYVIKQAKENGQPKPIFFLGAGASKSGGIPLAREIVTDILNKYPDAPKIKNLDENEKNYPKLMECLQPFERDSLLKGYIDEAKINVTHIYLAQLIKQGFVDYVLTVNFDNLMLRALSLYNEFPSTYDMAILKDLTTTTFKEKSVVFLHGQHHGLWLLNTEEEMEKVKSTVPRIFDSIKNRRPWIFIGYSGDDPIFEHIQNLGRFDNGLYWIAYNDNNPGEKVENFLKTPNTNASIIKGYDSDSFMLKLNTELKIDQPQIIDRPFTSVKVMLDNIVDIDDDEHFKGIKERLEISKGQVAEAIKQFEEGTITSKETMEKKSEIDILKKEIINLIIKEDYNIHKIKNAERKAEKLNNAELNNLLADLYFNWGTSLGNLATTKEGKESEDFYKEAFEKYQKALDIKPDKHEALYNWGNDLGIIAGTKEGKESEDLYKESFEKYQKAIEIKPDLHEAFNNWGTYLGNLAKTKEGKESEDLYKEAFTKFQKAIEIKPDLHEAFNNWGTYLGNLAKTKEGKESEDLYKEAFAKFQKAIEIKPDKHDAFNNWGAYLGSLAKTKEGKESEDLYKEAFVKFQKAIDIKPDLHVVFNNWGTYLLNLAKTKEGKELEDLYKEAFAKYQKAIEFGASSYNLSCIYALRNEKENALKYLDITLAKNEISVEFVIKDEDWVEYLEDEDFKNLLNKYKK